MTGNAEHPPPDGLFLGLDLGTSKIAAVVTDRDGGVLASVSSPHHAGVSSPPGRAEQDADRLRDMALGAISRLPAPLRLQVRAIGVTGQMHGLTMLDGKGRPVTNLITWQDGRCLEEPGFLERISGQSDAPLRTGYGCATLAWLNAREAVPAEAVSACSIHDWMVAILCGQTRAVTDPTDAASWGLFSLSNLDWDWPSIESAGILRSWIPEVRPCGSLAGRLAPEQARRLGLPPDIPVAVAMGDNQASLFAMLHEPEQELALTLGTGGQLSAVLPVMARVPPASSRFECRPYPDGRIAVVAASLNGGAAWAWLMESAASWRRDLGVAPLSTTDLYAKLNTLGLEAAAETAVLPTFAGERFDPELRGVLSGLNATPLLLGSLARGVARGIVANLRGMMPADVIAGRKRLVGSGNALRRNDLLRLMAEEVFGLPLDMPKPCEEAAAGAAMLAARLSCGPALQLPV